MRISRLILFVSDLPAMVNFYREKLGLVVISGERTGFVILDGGACQLALHHLPVGEKVIKPPPREDSYLKLVFYSKTVEADVAELKNRDVQMREIVRFGSITMCDGIDPEGNVFQISSREF